MLRWLLFLLFFIIIATLCTWLVKNDGSIVIEWFGLHIQTSTTFMILAGGVALSVIMTLVQCLIWVLHTPKRYQIAQTHKKHAKGLHAITKGFAAIAAGDSKQAQRLVHRATACLGTIPLTHILAAQSAQLAGNKKLAESHYAAMLEDSETKIIAIRGLLIAAMQEGNLDKALQLAEDVRQMHSSAPWAISLLLELYPKARKWDQATSIIHQAVKQKILSQTQADRMLGIIMITQAQEYYQKEDINNALKLAHQAYKLLPHFPPVIVTYSKILLHLHEKKKALKILEQGWIDDPHSDIIQTYMHAIHDESNLSRLTKIERLAIMHPHSIAGHTAIAQIAINIGNYGKARDHLTQALAIQETPFLCKLMADLERLKNANIDVINNWLNRAKTAEQLDASWHCTHCSLISHQWHSNCVRCHQFDSLVFDQDQLIAPFVEGTFISNSAV